MALDPTHLEISGIYFLDCNTEALGGGADHGFPVAKHWAGNVTVNWLLKLVLD